MDGLTTNGVLVMHPNGGFSEDSTPGVWREISVCGNVYALRDSRSAQQRGKLVCGRWACRGTRVGLRLLGAENLTKCPPPPSVTWQCISLYCSSLLSAFGKDEGKGAEKCAGEKSDGLEQGCQT